jgi:hypothetical protein
MHDRRGEAEGAGGLADAEGRSSPKVIPRDFMAGPTETYPLGFRPCEASAHALDDATALKLGDRGQDVHLEFASRRCAVNALREADERYAERLQLVEDQHEVLQTAAETIETPAHDNVATSLSGLGEERVQRWALFFGAADSAIHKRPGMPSASICEALQFLQLILGLLVER